MAGKVVQTGAGVTEDVKPKRNRSPNHPSINLKDAVERAGALYSKYKTNPMPIKIACSTLGYSTVNSTALQCIAALIAYGIVNGSGSGDDRKVCVSPEGERIVRNAPDRDKLLKFAALRPAIHDEVMNFYREKGLPHDDIIRQYLVWERPDGSRFTEEAVDGFIARLRETLSYAGLAGDGKNTMQDEAIETHDDEPRVFEGSFVQWTSQGIEQFSEPKRVRELSEDGQWAWLDGESTGVPVGELTIIEPWMHKKQPAVTNRSENPFVTRPQSAGPVMSFPLSKNNRVEIRLESRISRSDFERLKKLIELMEDSLLEDS